MERDSSGRHVEKSRTVNVVQRHAEPDAPKPHRYAARETMQQSNTLVEIKTILFDVLGLPASEIDESTNFFNLGMHSLTATRFASRIGQKFEVDVSMRMVFEHPTLKSLAEAIDRMISAKE
jgi:acyl carrier protein